MVRSKRRLKLRWLVVLLSAVALGLVVGPLGERIASQSDRLQLAEALQQAQNELAAAQAEQKAAQAAIDGEAGDPGTNEDHEEWTALGLYRYILLNTTADSSAYWDAQCAIDILTSGKNSTGHQYKEYPDNTVEGPVPDGVNASTYATIYRNVKLASRKDAASLDNFKTALDYIDEYNAYRARENSEEGYSLSTNVGLNCRLMAIACVQLDVSYDYESSGGHTQAYHVGENLSWGYSDPFYGWYDEEKVDYQNGDYSNVGHYLNIVDWLPEGDNNPTMGTGFAVHTGAPTYRVAHGQVFHTTSGYSQYNPTITYTTREFRNQWFDEYYQQQMDAGMHGTDSALHTQHEQALNQAKQRVSAAQSALQAAQTAYDNYVNLSKNDKVSVQAANVTYTGSAQTTSVTVSVDGEKLVEGTDYTVGSYANNTNVGTASLVVTGKGIWTGTKTAQFTINPKSISSVTITGIESKTYTGSAITQTPTVTDGSKTLRESTDYTLSYSSNVNVGTVTMTFTGKGNYTGSTTAQFAIVAADLQNATIAKIADQTYTGSALTPAPVVSMGGRTLQAGTDYDVSYRNNTNEGTATVTVTGKGNYTGSTSTTFAIVTKALKEQTITASDVDITMLQTGNVNASTSGDGTLSYVSANTAVAKVSSTGVVTPVSAGTTQITITASKTDTYQEATKVISVSVSKVSQTVTLAASEMTVVLGETAQIVASTSGDGTLSYTSYDTGVVTVDASGVVHTVSAGTTAVRVSASETERYTPSNKLVTVTVVESEVAQGPWTRLFGQYRYDTMAAIVTEGFDSSECAVIATGQNFPDALVASSLAGVEGCPVVLTKTSALSDQAREQLTKLGVTRVYVMGGATAVSNKVVSDLKGMGIDVTRVEGANRQATSLEVASRLPNNHYVVIANGGSFADALSIGPWCYWTGAPILLTSKSGNLSKAQLEWLETCSAWEIVVVGGTTVVPEKTVSAAYSALSADGWWDVDVTRLAGNNRYATSAIVAEWELEQGMSVSNIGVATGQDFPDALAGAALCGSKGSVLALVKEGNTSAVDAALEGRATDVTEGYILGGEKAVSAAIMEHCNELTR